MSREGFSKSPWFQADFMFAALVIKTVSHFKENPIYVLPENKLRDLSPNFHFHVSVSNLYIPTIGPPTFLQ